MDWRDYETTTARIYEALGQARGVRIICHGSNCKVQGKSGVEHQIDVLTQHDSGLHEHKTAIECKYWNETVSKDTVMKVEAILKDANIEKGVIVSKRGFTPDAIDYAKFANISLVVLRPVVDDDWIGRVKDIQLKLVMRGSAISGVDLNTSDEAGRERRSLPFDAGDALVKTPSENKPLREILEQASRERNREDGDSAEKRILMPTGTQIVSPDETQSFPLRSITIHFRDVVEERVISTRGEDYVSMIMEAVFEGKTFGISPSGQPSLWPDLNQDDLQ